MKATFRVWRGDRKGGKFQDYSTEISEGMVVLDAVHKIQAESANDLACRWNCKAGKCGSCSAEINGLPKLMCMTRLGGNSLSDLIVFGKRAGEYAAQYAKKEKRPTLIEAETYRYRGHSMSDPGKYRTKEEVEQMMKSDPILLFGRRLMEQERFTQADLDAIDKEVLAQMDDAVAFTEQSPDPTPESLYEDVYVRSPYIHANADKDPAWRAAKREDRVPEKLPPWTPPPAAPPVEAPPAAEAAASGKAK